MEQQLEELRKENEELKRLNAVYFNAYDTMASIVSYLSACYECDCPTAWWNGEPRHTPSCIQARAQVAFEEYSRIKGGEA